MEKKNQLSHKIKMSRYSEFSPLGVQSRQIAAEMEREAAKKYNITTAGTSITIDPFSTNFDVKLNGNWVFSEPKKAMAKLTNAQKKLLDVDTQALIEAEIISSDFEVYNSKFVVAILLEDPEFRKKVADAARQKIADESDEDEDE